MGLIDLIKGRRPQPKPSAAAPFFELLTERSPSFTSFNGGVYEMELTRAAIDRFATACGKLKPEVVGAARPRIERAIRTSPNSMMTWPRFLYRLATILECDTTAYVVPELSQADGQTVVGLWPLKCEFAELVEFRGQPWVRFHFLTGDTAAIELANVCIVSKYQYGSDLFGEPNELSGTMKLLKMQEKAQEGAIQAGAAIKFIGALTGQVHEDEIEGKRERFSKRNLSDQNRSGIMIYDQTFQNVEQVKPFSYAISDSEMARITQSVYNYFGVNESILQNCYTEDQWNAFYEGKVEPFAIQLGEGLSHMLFTRQERRRNAISFSSNRLEYATSASKRNMIRDMLDRGVFSIDDAREILQLPPLPDGEGKVRVIRGEYVDASMMRSHKKDSDPTEHDLTKKDTDAHGEADADRLD